MARKTIEISAEVSSAKSSIKELDQLIKDTAKAPKKIQIFDEKSSKTMQDWASKTIPLIKKDIDKVKDSMKGMTDVDLLVKTKQTAMELEKTLHRMEKISLGDMKGGMDKEGGVGGIGGMLKGAAMRFLAPLAVVGAVIGKGKAAYDQRVSETDDRLSAAGKMGGKGYENFVNQGGPYQGTKFGYDPNETLQLANNLLKTVGNIDQLSRVQKVSRAYGLDTGEVSNIMGGMRRTSGQGGVDKNFSMLMSTAFSSGLDQSLLSEYMQITSEFTKKIALEGSADTQQIMRSVAGMVRQGGVLEDTARTAKNLEGIDSSIKNSQGARFGFYAEAFERGLGKKATGSQTVLAMNQGLFGADTSRLTALSGDQRKELGLGGFDVSRRSKAITEQFEGTTKGMDTPSKALVASRVTGIKDAAEALNFITAMKSGKFSEKELREMEKKGKMSGEEKALADISKTLDYQTKQREALAKENNSRIGTPILTGVNAIMTSVRALESHFVGGNAGGIVSEEKNAQVSQSIEDIADMGDMGTSSEIAASMMARNWKRNAEEIRIAEEKKNAWKIPTPRSDFTDNILKDIVPSQMMAEAKVPYPAQEQTAIASTPGPSIPLAPDLADPIKELTRAITENTRVQDKGKGTVGPLIVKTQNSPITASRRR